MTTATRWFSLRRRLVALLLAGIAAGWLLTLAWSYRDTLHEIDELFDVEMVQIAQTLLALASKYDEDDDKIAELPNGRHKYQKKLIFQLWDDEGHLLLRSHLAPLQPLTTSDGFSESTANGHWHYYSQWDKERKLRVQVGENHHVRKELTGRIVIRMLVPVLFGLPLLGIWLWFTLRHGLSTIATVSDQVDHRASSNLSPLQPETAPREIRPLVEAINALLARIDKTLDNERRFTADAAHELRTPLAALVTQAQVATRARDEAERRHALDQIAAISQRASRLVDQLLTLARLETAADLPCATVHLDDLAAEVCADLGATALNKEIDLSLDTAGNCTAEGNADLLRVLLRNLVDNAIRYTPTGGKITVTLSAQDGGFSLVVADNGPGIPVSERENALRPFHRLADPECEGSGLGLSIVARIAELHGARLTLTEHEDGPGLVVSLHMERSG